MCSGRLAHREHGPYESDQEPAEGSARGQRTVPSRCQATEHSAGRQIGVLKLVLYEGTQPAEAGVSRG